MAPVFGNVSFWLLVGALDSSHNPRQRAKAEGPHEGQELNIHKKGKRETELGGLGERKNGRMEERKTSGFFFLFTPIEIDLSLMKVNVRLLER